MAASSLFIVAAREGDAQAATEAARRLGLSVTGAEYTPDTADAIERSRAAVVLVDVAALPGGGEVLCRQVARLPHPSPLIALVASPSQAAAALSSGAAACLAHPVDPSWLAAQIASLLRIATTPEPSGQASGPLTIRGLKIDPRRCEVSFDSRTVPLTPTEFRVLSSLARSPGLVTSGHDLAEEALDLQLPEQEAMELLKVHVYRLRQKLSRSGADPTMLRNVRGFGYMLERRAPAAKPVRPTAADLKERQARSA